MCDDANKRNGMGRHLIQTGAARCSAVRATLERNQTTDSTLFERGGWSTYITQSSVADKIDLQFGCANHSRDVIRNSLKSKP